MTDEHPGQEPEPELSRPPGMAEEDHDDAAVLEGAGDFTSGEGLVAFSGILILGVWLIFSILTTEYYIAHMLFLLSALAAIVPRLDRANTERVHSVGVIMKVLGYGIALMGLVALIEDVRFEAFDEIWALLGGLITYAAAVMAFIGARQIKI